MELKQIETFVAIMKEGSFAEAARRLGYAQSSVTAHVRLLEESLEVRLFEKRSRLNVPTDAARSFLPYALEMLDLDRNAHNAMLSASGKMESRIVVAASEAVLMVDVLKAFMEKHPQTRLKIRVCACRDIPPLVGGGDADLGFFIAEGAAAERDFPLRVVASKKVRTLLVRRGESALPPAEEDFRRGRFVCARGGLYREMTEKAFELWKIEPRFVEAGSVPAIKELCMAGMGTALLPHVSVAKECAAGLLYATPWEEDGRCFHPELKLAVHKNRTLSPGMTELCRRLGEAIDSL